MELHRLNMFTIYMTSIFNLKVSDYLVALTSHTIVFYSLWLSIFTHSLKLSKFTSVV